MSYNFKTEFGRNVFYQKYAQGINDTWPLLAQRVVDDVCGTRGGTAHALMSIGDRAELVQAITNMKFIPAGRYLYYAGRDVSFFNNCFNGEQEFLTDVGIRKLADAVGETVNIYSPVSKTFLPATVKQYGIQQLNTVTLCTRRGHQHTQRVIHVTAEHRWPLDDGTVTTSLKVGDQVTTAAPVLPYNKEAYLHGLVFADGNLHVGKKHFTHQLRLCGKKKEYVDLFKDYTITYPAFSKGDPIVNITSEVNWKELPTTTDEAYIASFIKGWIAFDGCGDCTIHTIDKNAIEYLQRHIVFAGYIIVGKIAVVTKNSNYGKRKPLYSLRFKNADLHNGFKVKSIEPYKKDTVFCVEEPIHKQFTLGCGVVTGNCLVFVSKEDTREAWADFLYQTTAALMSGAGIGNCYSVFRPKGSPLGRSGGLASGPLPLMSCANEIGRNVMQGGSRRCLPAGTRVSVPGAYKNIEDIVSGDIVRTRHGDFPVTGVFDQGEQEITTLHTKYGAISGTDNHKLLSASFGRRKEWRVIGNIRKGHKIYYHPTPMQGDIIIDTNWAYTLGYFMGDGCAYQCGRTAEITFQFDWNHDYPKQIELIANIMKAKGCNPITRQGHGRCTELRCRSIKLVPEFQGYKAPHCAPNIPKDILNWDIDARCAFVAGWFDADGYYGRDSWKVCNFHPETIESLQQILRSLGLLSVVSGHELKVNSYQRSMYVKTVGRYAFKKFTAIDKETSEVPVFVTDVTTTGLKHTYDIEVQYAHEFIADDFISHNSALYASLHWNHGDILSFINCKEYDDETKARKLADFNSPAPMDMTNISVNWDDAGLEAASIKGSQGHDVWIRTVTSMLRTAEPGFSFNLGENEHEVGRNACAEVTSPDDCDICNLGSMNLANITSIQELTDLTQLAAKFLICGSIRANVPTEKVRLVRELNRTTGLGVMGVHEWLLQRGEQYNMTPTLQQWMTAFKAATKKGADEQCDHFYLNRPRRYNAIAPAGSIGILAGTTTGVEPLFAPAYQRRYLRDSTTWVYQNIVDPTASRMIQDYDITDPDTMDCAYNIGYKQRIEFQADMQDHIDMAISSTCNLPAWGSEGNNADGVEAFSDVLLKYAPRLRGFTAYADGCRGGQPITVMPYTEAIKDTSTIHVENEGTCSSGT